MPYLFTAVIRGCVSTGRAVGCHLWVSAIVLALSSSVTFVHGVVLDCIFKGGEAVTSPVGLEQERSGISAESSPKPRSAVDAWDSPGTSPGA